MKANIFDTKCQEIKPELIEIIKALQADIEDDFRAFEGDEEPGIQITIATDAEFSDWAFQSGDNSYSGACYHFPHWGVAGIYRDSEPEEIADALFDSLADVITFGN